uniref:Terminal uridylyltransferase 4 n=1 Tax=Phallusia mammillata TaxID=59560 RepID=A0A6F9DWI7_9ASCI|nr:terminal uridylyltransferase 4 [Phallusia mammillata]
MSHVAAGKRMWSSLFLQYTCSRSIAKFATKQDEPPCKNSNAVSSRSDKEQQEHFDLLGRICSYVFDACKPDAEILRKHHLVKQHLERNCHFLWGKDAKAELFGSAANGFGFKSSDLDYFVQPIKLPLSSKGSKSVAVSMGNRLAKQLRQDPCFNKIMWIPHCRVPILRCVHISTQRELDITFDNGVVARNTRLLAHYAAIDCRCQILGFAMKLLTKMAGIANSQHNFLSSYAYTLMVIYYLQQLKDPVLPQLQKIGQCGSILCGVHETWFYDGELEGVWPEMGVNKQSVGELWLGLLYFYAYEFDYNSHSVCIRGLSRKQLRHRHMTIYDPFELSRNLGQPLSQNNAQHIQHVFRTAYQNFSQSPPPNMKNPELVKHYFLAFKRSNRRFWRHETL